jgi:predicted CXXCH cytochrome family protein
MRAARTILVVLGPALMAAAPESRIDQSKHNFYGPGERSSRPGMDLCQFCHVPNRLETSTSPAPAWDPKSKGRNAALSERADPNGPPLPLRWAGSTVRCMSCHDATVSSINIVYRPGSASLRFDEIAGDKRRREGARRTYFALPDEWGGRVMGNHPVAIPYPLDLEQSEYRRYEPRAELLTAGEWQPDPRKKGLKLFTDRSGFDVLTGTSGVECASCHDPHGTPNAYFLRVAKDRSELCLSCHRK